MTFKGANLTDLESLRTTIVRAHRQLLGTAEHTSGMVRLWEIDGRKGYRLHTDIRKLGTGLRDTAEKLQLLTVEIDRNIDEQRWASRGEGGHVHLAQVTTPTPGLTEHPRADTRAVRAADLVRRLGLDPAFWEPRREFRVLEPYVRAVYDYYGRLFQNDNRLQWAGMARLAGAVVYAGFQDLRAVRDLLRDGVLRPEPGTVGWHLQRELGQLTDAQIAYYEQQFLHMHRAVFLDMAYQHDVYSREGIAGIRRLAAAGELAPGLVSAWEKIDSGDPAKVAEGNRELLQREQFRVLQPYYDEIRTTAAGRAFTRALSLATQSPIPGGQSFWAHGGNIADFNDRWDWIDRDMLPRYQELLRSPEGAQLIGRPLPELARRFRRF